MGTISARITTITQSGTTVDRRSIGQYREQQACDYLCAAGLSLVERNYHTRMGEIDLIMRDNTYLVFVEVRYRKNSRRGTAAESVTYHKQCKIIAAAQHYLQKNKLTEKVTCRFDVVSIQQAGESDSIHWIKNAFQLG